jgi:hypothetical protein
MKTDAGWKLWIRKPSAAPATIAARTPALVRPRSNAITEKATALIAHTPAASPSTPSEKFTTFISPTMPMTVSVPPSTAPKSSAPRNGIVTCSTRTPATTGISAAAICPTSFTAGESSDVSSIAPIAAISAAPSRIPVVC